MPPGAGPAFSLPKCYDQPRFKNNGTPKARRRQPKHEYFKLPTFWVKIGIILNRGGMKMIRIASVLLDASPLVLLPRVSGTTRRGEEHYGQVGHSCGGVESTARS
jgi:hypothetical protein